ncbi:MAG: DNA polymerase IV, partial [Lachnospiraceae bacterium]
MGRTILHSDINCSYASIEHLYHPELAGKPLAVGGDPEARHGIVLTADYLAKKKGVKTGMALWQAKQVCPELNFISPRMDLYLRFSRMAHEIYGEYTDLQEPYGITTIHENEFRTKAWQLPASDLLYVGRSTNQKLERFGIKTIGDLARTDESLLESQLGKMGGILWAFANGLDDCKRQVLSGKKWKLFSSS